MLRLFTMATIALFAIAPMRAVHAQTATQDIIISATVLKTCTINNAAVGTPDTATIAITASGSVDTSVVTPTNSPYANVSCNAPSDLQLTSLNGGVKNATTVSGLTNIINYTASATWHGVTATLNTSTLATAVGAESGTAQPVSTAFSGSLSVSITPIANSQPLVQGAYSDTLRVTLTPQ